MSVNFNLCPASVKQMADINRTLKSYGTPYLLPKSTDQTCIFKYICNELCLSSKKYIKRAPKNT